MRAAACALLSLSAACSTPPRSSDASVRSADLGSHAEGRAATLDAGLAAAHTHSVLRDKSAALAADASSASGAGTSVATGAPAASGPASKHLLRVRALTGRVSSGELTVVEGATLGDDAPLSLARGARLTLSLDDYVRVELSGPAVARAMPGGRPALVVREGAVTVDVAPRGQHGTQSAFWLVTPLASVDVNDSARLLVRVSAKGAGELVVVSGHAQLALAEAPRLLTAGSAHCVGPDGLSALSRPFSTLEEAAQVFANGPSCAGRSGTDGALRERALSTALDAVQQREQSELSLLAEHARLVSLGDTRAQAVRSVLAGSAAVLVRQRAWATAQHAQLDAWLLGRTPTTSQKALLERAYRLAPY